MIDPRAIRRLEAMDVQVWRARAPKPVDAGDVRPDANASADAEPVAHPPEASPEKAGQRSARIRLEAGSGRWLLVVDDADRARHATLIEDIRATLGAGDCRFGTWSDSPEAGVAVADWEAHGIRHALVFGGQVGPGFVQGGELDRLAASGEARRALWRRLQPLLAA